MKAGDKKINKIKEKVKVKDSTKIEIKKPKKTQLQNIPEEYQNESLNILME